MYEKHCPFSGASEFRIQDNCFDFRTPLIQAHPDLIQAHPFVTFCIRHCRALIKYGALQAYSQLDAIKLKCSRECRLVCLRGTAAAEVHKSHCCFSFFEPFSVCGRPPLNTRIVGGEDAPLGSWPWQASLTRNGGHFCGGSLINNNFVLTAAHCFFPSTDVEGFAVVLGRQSQESSNPNEVSRNIAEIIIHPEYNPFSDDNENDNDICLLRLSSPVEFTNYIMPICLAAQSSTIHAGTVSWVTGWGTINSGVPLPSPQNLQEVDVPVVGNRQCHCKYGEGTITDNMICAGLSTGGKDSCQGDSGGPLVSKQGNRWILIGVVSFGQGCAEAEFPGVYARVSPYNEWINSHITDNQPGFVLFTSVGTDSDFNVTCDGLSPAPTAAHQPIRVYSRHETYNYLGHKFNIAGEWNQQVNDMAHQFMTRLDLIDATPLHKKQDGGLGVPNCMWEYTATRQPHLTNMLNCDNTSVRQMARAS
ncbi:Serine protease 27 [Merluccius polli]|uniref:Serine protease 27 n=1 Tax=Merluccius polli TaxID=89951 RepID=A0AA47NZ35_MERPO|nr:Serine protease 27 [Merluccius polli]